MLVHEKGFVLPGNIEGGAIVVGRVQNIDPENLDDLKESRNFSSHFRGKNVSRLGPVDGAEFWWVTV